MRRAVKLGMAVLMGMTIVSCSSSSSRSAATSTAATAAPTSAARASTTAARPAPTACSLLDAATIAAAAGPGFGEPIAQAPQSTPYGTYTVCTWTNSAAGLTSIHVSVWADRGAYDDAKHQVSELKPGTGIGDESFTASFASVYAIAGAHTLFVQYYNPDQPDAANLAISTALAAHAAGGLAR